MEIADWIDICIKDYKDDNYSFIKACRNIASHKKLKLCFVNYKLAVFEIQTSTFNTKITINNDKLLGKYDPDYVLDKVSLIANLPKEAIKAKNRKREITEARFAYCLVNILYKEESGLSYSKIGQHVNLSHCDVLHAKKVSHIDNIKKIYEQTLKIL